MREFFGRVSVGMAVLLALAGGAYAQVHVEFGGLGGYNFNLAFPSTLNVFVTSDFPNVKPWLPAWQSFIDQLLLQQDNGAAYGGWVGVQLSRWISLEAGYETGSFRFHYANTDTAAILSVMHAAGWSPVFTFRTSGGSLRKITLNIVFNFPLSGAFIPYLTLGIGEDDFKLNDGPAVLETEPTNGASQNWHFMDHHFSSIIGGGGLKLLLGNNFGVRVDGRFYYSNPDVVVTFFHPNDDIVESFPPTKIHQVGLHLDGVLSAGLFVRL